MQLSFFGATQTVTGSRYLLACGERRLLMGSDAELVLRTSPVPVLLVRDEPEAG